MDYRYYSAEFFDPGTGRLATALFLCVCMFFCIQCVTFYINILIILNLITIGACTCFAGRVEVACLHAFKASSMTPKKDRQHDESHETHSCGCGLLVACVHIRHTAQRSIPIVLFPAGAKISAISNRSAVKVFFSFLQLPG